MPRCMRRRRSRRALAIRSSANSDCCAPLLSATACNPASRGLARPAGALLLEEARILLLEAREPAAAVDQLLLAAGPSRVRFRIDVEMQRIARLAPGRAGGEFGAVGHHDL